MESQRGICILITDIRHTRSWTVRGRSRGRQTPVSHRGCLIRQTRLKALHARRHLLAVEALPLGDLDQPPENRILELELDAVRHGLEHHLHGVVARILGPDDGNIQHENHNIDDEELQ